MKVDAPRAMARRMAVGASYFLSARVLVRLLAIVNIAVLGRLLSPDDFGIMALAIVVVGLNEAVQNRQFEYGLIRMENPQPAHFNTAFGLSLSLGVAMAVGMAVAAAPLARVMNAPALEGALYWLTLIPLIDSLRNPYFALFERDLLFAPAASVESVSRICLTLTVIVMGYIWRDYWAMVAGMLMLSLSRTVLTHVLAPQRPSFGLSRWREFLRFGGWLSASGLLGFAEFRAATVLVGAWFENAVVGVYHVGSDMAAMATTALAQPLVNAIYPALVAVADDVERFRRGYLKAQATVLAIFLPVGAGIALTAPELLRVLLGQKWADAVPVLQIIAPALALATLSIPVYAATMARNRTRAHVEIAAGGIAVQAPLLFLGYWTFGLTGVLCARVLGSLARCAFALHHGARASGDSAWAPLRAAWRSFAAVGLMASAVSAARVALPPSVSFIDAAIALVGLAGIGAVVYGLAHLALWRLAGAPDGVERMALDMAAKLVARVRRKNYSA